MRSDKLEDDADIGAHRIVTSSSIREENRLKGKETTEDDPWLRDFDPKIRELTFENELSKSVAE